MCFHLRKNETGHFITVMVFFDLLVCLWSLQYDTVFYCWLFCICCSRDFLRLLEGVGAKGLLAVTCFPPSYHPMLNFLLQQWAVSSPVIWKAYLDRTRKIPHIWKASNRRIFPWVCSFKPQYELSGMLLWFSAHPSQDVPRDLLSMLPYRTVSRLEQWLVLLLVCFPHLRTHPVSFCPCWLRNFWDPPEHSCLERYAGVKHPPLVRD